MLVPLIARERACFDVVTRADIFRGIRVADIVSAEPPQIKPRLHLPHTTETRERGVLLGHGCLSQTPCALLESAMDYACNSISPIRV